MQLKLEHISTKHLSYIATTLSIIGAVLLSAGQPALMPASLIAQIAGGTLWCIYAHRTHQRPLLLVNIAFIVVEVVGLINWI